MKVLGENNIADIKAKILDSAAGVPIVNVTLSGTSLVCAGGTDLSKANVFLVRENGSNSLPLDANKSYTLTNTGTSNLPITWGSDNDYAQQINLLEGICVKRGNGCYVIVDSDKRLPFFETQYDSSGLSYRLLPNDKANIPGLAEGFQCLFRADSTHSDASGCTVSMVFGSMAHQYRLVMLDGQTGSFIPVTTVTAGRVYPVTIVDLRDGSSPYAVVGGTVSGGGSSEPTWIQAAQSFSAPTSTTWELPLFSGSAPSLFTITKIHLDFVWTKSTTGEVSITVAPYDTYTANGTEVYTSNTTRSAANRNNWPTAGKISNIAQYDNIHADIEISPAANYNDDWGDLVNGFKVKSSYSKTGSTFYEGTFYTKPVSSFGSAATSLFLKFNTTPSIQNFQVYSEYLKHN